MALAPAHRRDWQVVAVLVVSALMLVLRANEYRYSLDSLVNYLQTWASVNASFLERPLCAIAAEENQELARLVYWSVWHVAGYFIFPALIIKLVFRRSLREYGMKIFGASRGWWVYVAMYLAILPLVMYLSTTDSFQHTYPFLKPELDESQRPVIDQAYWNRFWIWQFCYALQFVALEFFFRGFMVHGTRLWLGPYSIFVMMIPYCMIHFGKPLPETLGAILAGIVLGFMSLKTRSVYMGALLHIAVAVTMDLAAIWQRT